MNVIQTTKLSLKCPEKIFFFLIAPAMFCLHQFLPRMLGNGKNQIQDREEFPHTGEKHQIDRHGNQAHVFTSEEIQHGQYLM